MELYMEIHRSSRRGPLPGHGGRKPKPRTPRANKLKYLPRRAQLQRRAEFLALMPPEVRALFARQHHTGNIRYHLKRLLALDAGVCAKLLACGVAIAPLTERIDGAGRRTDGVG